MAQLIIVDFLRWKRFGIWWFPLKRAEVEVVPSQHELRYQKIAYYF